MGASLSLSRREILERMVGLRVLVVGDVMLDEYVRGDIQRVSPEAPVPVVALGRTEYRLGGAANVASNLAALGCRTELLGAIGADDDGQRVAALAREREIEAHLMRSVGRPTTRKTRVIARGQHVVRLDQEVASPLPAAEQQALLSSLAAVEPTPALVILSDYAKGVVTRRLAAEVIRWAHERGACVLVDPKTADFTAYAGAGYLTPNARETAVASGLPVSGQEEVVRAAERLLEQAGALGILVTRGGLGMALVTRSGAHFVPARVRTAFDVTGAGDTVIAVFGAALAAGGAPFEAMVLANLAAGITVGSLGAVAPTRVEIAHEAGIELDGAAGPAGGDARLANPRLLSLEAAARQCQEWRTEGRRIVFTNGCFDVLHAGHVVLLEEARAHGDVLVVGLNSDASVRRLKGTSRPVQPLADRARVLAGLRAVDRIVAFEEDTPLQLVLALRPDVLLKGGDYEVETIVGAREVQGWGGEVVVVPRVADRSTTELLRR